jgi:Flp pilus assembly protein TadG
MLGRIVLLVLILLVLIAGGNDVYRYSEAQKHLRAVTDEVARWAGNNGLAMTRDQAAQQAAAMAAEQGVTVYQYDQSDQGVRVWTQAPVNGTLIAGTIINMMHGQTYQQAKLAPFMITTYREAGINTGQ